MPEINIGLISWGAIFAGVICILAFQMAFSMLGLALGLRLVPTDEPKKVGIGMALYSLVTTLVSVYFGAWIAGRFAGDIGSTNAMMHGIVAWGLTVLITELIMATGAGMMISGIMGMVKSAVRAVSGGVQQAMQAASGGVQQAMMAAAPKYQESGGMRDQFDQMHRDIENLLRQTGKAEFQPEGNLEDTVRKVFMQGKTVDKEAIVSVLEKQTKISHQQAEVTADRWINTFQNARDKVEGFKEEAAIRSREAAERSAAVLSQVALLSFIMLALSMAVAMYGASQGAIV